MKLRNILIINFISIIILAYLAFKGYSTDEWKILLCIIIMIIIYIDALRSISKNSGDSILSDGRFYIWSFIVLYSIWVPILALISRIINTPFSSLEIYGATKYNILDLLITCYTSLFLLFGMRVGLFIATRIKTNSNIKISKMNNVSNRRYKFWFIVSIISTFVFLAPFIMGGFSLLRSGGTILDVESIASIFSGNIPMTIIGFFFSSEIMTISTSILIMYYLESKNTIRKKAVVLLLILIFHAILSILTTRSARFMIILIVSFSLIMENKELRNNKMFKKLAVIVPVFMLFVYFIDYILVDQVRSNLSFTNQNLIIEIMRRFDGIGPYDALFKAVHSEPDITMITNIIYSFLRPVPIIGQSIISVLGINQNASPLYLWMSTQYPSIYSAGGGLAYMPHIEAYLIGGYFGCLFFGIVYGLIFGIKRSRVKNIIVIAMSLMLARGSMGVVASLSVPYIFIGYYLYERVIANITLNKINKKGLIYEK